MIQLDRDHLVDVITDRLATTESPRQRTMLERMRVHAAAERDGDLETLVGTLGEATDYHFWELSGDVGPKTARASRRTTATWSRTTATCWSSTASGWSSTTSAS